MTGLELLERKLARRLMNKEAEHAKELVGMRRGSAWDDEQERIFTTWAALPCLASGLRVLSGTHEVQSWT